MVNLIAAEEVVPELVQHDFTADKVIASVCRRSCPTVPRETECCTGLARVKEPSSGWNTNGNPTTHPADRAAQIILTLKPPGASIPLRQ